MDSSGRRSKRDYFQAFAGIGYLILSYIHFRNPDKNNTDIAVMWGFLVAGLVSFSAFLFSRPARSVIQPPQEITLPKSTEGKLSVLMFLLLALTTLLLIVLANCVTTKI
ncbi:Uncharacterised protein [BD1-7 clade bacterium]|uniref:Uncharacterized protein n=1 Tax=BD1-7 clade bacterium TaxID=2029982 RepID=A0A5S9NQL1_9GAMM|nr:Uncharacterised protein [BD1-7 clade bacterium]